MCETLAGQGTPEGNSREKVLNLTETGSTSVINVYMLQPVFLLTRNTTVTHDFGGRTKVRKKARDLV